MGAFFPGHMTTFLLRMLLGRSGAWVQPLLEPRVNSRNQVEVKQPLQQMRLCQSQGDAVPRIPLYALGETIRHFSLLMLN